MILWIDVTVLVAVRWISQLFPQNSGIKDKTLKTRCPHFFSFSIGPNLLP